VFYPRLFQAIMQGEQVEQSIIQARQTGRSVESTATP
jgi:hypothetical protein